MKTHLEFHSTNFPSHNDESEGVNCDAGIFGKRLAFFLARKLTSKGYAVDEPFHEDWGWCVVIKHQGDFTMFVGCCSQEKNDFLCFIEPNKPQIRRWFKKIDVKAPVENLAATLHQILSEEPTVTKLQWVALPT